MKTHKRILLLLALWLIGLNVYPQTGTITNISVQPRTDGSGMLDVHFNLSGEADSYNILMEVSFDAGNTYTPIPVTYLSGDLQDVSPGSRHLVWDGYGSFPDEFSAQTRIKIVATAGNGNGDDTEIVDVLNPATGKTWMDRNLGASRAATSSTDSLAYGHLYQWGRAADGHQVRTSVTTSTLSNSDTPGHGDFISGMIPLLHDWRYPQNINLWQGVNGINNPCPAGYRLPTEAELNAECQSWSSNDATGAFASPLKLPVAGYRNFGTGKFYHVGLYGHYWSSNVEDVGSKSLSFYSSHAGTGSLHRGDGGSVRCLKDDSQITYTLNLNVSPSVSGTVTGAGLYPESTYVSITATSNEGYSFVNWTGDIEHIADVNFSITTLIMPAQNITLMANFEEDSGEIGDWPTDTETEVIDVLNPATGKIWMDRNLGASRAATSSTDAEAYGDLYQWGRAADGHQKRTSNTTSSLSNSDTPGHGYFILAPNNPWDWHSPQDTNLWQGVNGINNPCPAGYRLPTEAELKSERLSWNSNNSAGAFASPLKLPLAGNRNYSSGSIDAGTYGFYWSSTVSIIQSRSLFFFDNYANIGSISRAWGYSVRCLKDDTSD